MVCSSRAFFNLALLSHYLIIHCELGIDTQLRNRSSKFFDATLVAVNLVS